MGYTLSFDASVKCTKGDVGGLLHHIGRDVDQANGCEVRHSNKDIDQARTGLNTTLVADGKGGWMTCTDTQQIADALDARLAHVKKPLRKDAVVLRGLVLQLDPDWYKEHTDTGERIDAEQHMMDWAADTFGAENLIYVALHEDEGNRHLHLGFCPVTADGRLSQKDWFPGPADLRKKHDEFRQHMRDAGYDVAKERKKPGKHAKRMSVEEYKDFARLQAERRDVAQQQGQLEADKQQLHADRLNARAEAQNIRRQAQNAGAVYIENAKATAAAAEDEATEYRAKRHKEADDEAARILADAEAEAARIRADAQKDAKATTDTAQAEADAIKARLRDKMQREMTEKRTEYKQLDEAHKRLQKAAQGDLRAWEAREAKEGVAALLEASGAAVAVYRVPAATAAKISSGLSDAMQRLQEINARTDARWAASGHTTVEGPTM